MGTAPLVLVVSDAIGETAELVARAALSQFPLNGVEVRRYPYVDDERGLQEVLQQAAARPQAVIIFTLVRPELRAELRKRAEELGIPFVDVLGPALTALQDVMPSDPSLKPGLSHRLDAEYFRRVEAIEFAVKYDDGKDPRGLQRADVVLVGVSRTSKTPVSMYLAHRRLKVANVPLVPEVPPPVELTELPPAKVVGLTINPVLLHQIRAERLKTIGLGAHANYADLGRIMEELDYAESVFRRLGCAVVDVSNKAVEETANRVLEIIQWGGVKTGG